MTGPPSMNPLLVNENYTQRNVGGERSGTLTEKTHSFAKHSIQNGSYSASSHRPVLQDFQQHRRSKDYRRYHRHDSGTVPGQYEDQENQRQENKISTEQLQGSDSKQRISSVPYFVTVGDDRNDDSSLMSIGVVSSVTEATALNSVALNPQCVNQWKEADVLKKFEETGGEQQNTLEKPNLRSKGRSLTQEETKDRLGSKQVSFSGAEQLMEARSMDRTGLMKELREAVDFRARAFHSDVIAFWDEKITILEECLKTIERDGKHDTTAIQDFDNSDSHMGTTHGENVRHEATKQRHMRLQAQSDLLEGESLRAQVKGSSIRVTVPKGGLRKGDTIYVPYRDCIGSDSPEPNRKGTPDSGCPQKKSVPRARLILEDDEDGGRYLAPCVGIRSCFSVPTDWFVTDQD